MGMSFTTRDLFHPGPSPPFFLGEDLGLLFRLLKLLLLLLTLPLLLLLLLSVLILAILLDLEVAVVAPDLLSYCLFPSTVPAPTPSRSTDRLKDKLRPPDTPESGVSGNISFRCDALDGPDPGGKLVFDGCGCGCGEVVAGR